MTHTHTNDIAGRWRALLAAEPGLRIREAAKRLGSVEAALLATRLDGESVIRLRGPWPEIVGKVGGLGQVMALTRNEMVVHERHGTYGELSLEGHVGLILGEDIDLRIFFGAWAHGFAVTEETRAGPRRSLQFFDAAGHAIHKIYATEATDREAFETLVAAYRDEDQSAAAVTLRPTPAKPAPLADSQIDADSLRAAWAALQDTHDFFPLLRKHKVAREQAFRLAGTEFAVPLENGSARRVLQTAAQDGLPIMVFVGNPGMIQIHTGPVEKLLATGPWFNVLDPLFNLHLREDGIASSWLVRKPSVDGTVTSLELFDAQGELVVSFFGKRKPGEPELSGWRDLAESLATPQAAA